MSICCDSAAAPIPCKATSSPCPRPPQLWAANHSVLVGVLPIAQFASGHTFFVQVCSRGLRDRQGGMLLCSLLTHLVAAVHRDACAAAS